MKFSKILLAGLLIASPLTTMAGPEDILPKPQSLAQIDMQPFALSREVRLVDPTNSTLLRSVLTDYGCTLVESTSAPTITVKIVSEIPGAFLHQVPYMPEEAYRLNVETNAVTIETLSPTGVIRAAQTLMQLAEGTTPAVWDAVTITDWPAFKVRGFMHDVGRSFIPFEQLKRQIDLLSRFKVNVFHWHLTEKLAWRMEIKRYPQLTASENMIRYAGDYYTQEQCRELDAYAAERGVTIIPEIDMPGHSDVFTKAMGFNMQSDQGVAALKNILDEVVDVFPNAPYIHIGGDEVQITYPNFLKTMANYVRGKGKKVVVWNRLVAGAPTAEQCDMTQMWATAGRAVNGLPNIDCRYNYTNHFDVYADLVGIYKSNIYYEQRGTNTVAGTISAAWNDTKTNSWEDIVRQNNMYANVLASAERAWRGGGKQYIEAGGTTLPNAGEEFEEFADFERRFLFHKAHCLSDQPISYVKQTNVRWRISDPFPNGGNAAMQFPPEQTDEGDGVLPTTFTYNGQTYGSRTATGAGIYLRHIWHPTIPSWYTNPAYSQTAYAWTYVYSPKAQTVGAQVEFYTYSRSGNERAPQAGQWDRRGSKLWVNGTEIAAPTWDQPDASIPQDNATQGLKNENLTARPVVQIQLREGWNKVLMRLPHAAASGTGRDKWQFTFVLTDPTGRDALEGIIYSPSKSMDADAEQLSELLDEVESYIRRNFSATEVGYYPASISVSTENLCQQIRTALTENPTAEERAQMYTQLSDAYTKMQSKAATQGINQPRTSDGTNNVWYTMSTPLRDGRYITAKGAGQTIIGESYTSATAVPDAGHWCFVRRTDGNYDIKDAQYGTYISPASSNNTGLKTVATAPSTGWKVQASDEPGYVIVTSGTAQFNQTKSSQNYQLYNWGNGTNTTDTGCKFLVKKVSGSELQELTALLDEVETYMEQNFSDTEVGFFPASLTASLQSLAEEMRATLSQSLSNTERQAQLTQLTEAYLLLQSQAAEQGINQPIASTATGNAWYVLKTPLRDNRIVTAKGAGQVIYGETYTTSIPEAAQWRFLPRTDGTFDIQDAQYKTYISPTSDNNTALTAVTAAPTNGWSILPANEIGYVIITSGTVQFNQTNAGLGYKLYNWGNGTNITDTGCKYRILLDHQDGTSVGIATPLRPAAASPLYDLSGRRITPPQHGQGFIQNGQKYIWGK